MQTIRKAAIGGVLTIAALGGGALGAALLNGSASAQTDPTTTAPAATAPAATTAPTDPSGGTSTPAPGGRGDHGTHDPSKGGHVANGITETLLTGDDAAKATAAAQAAVPGGTIERVETDAEGATYEAHVVKADGSHVTVKMDASFSVTSIEDGAK